MYLKQAVLFKPRVDGLEDQNEREEHDRGPQLGDARLCLLQIRAVLIVLQLFVDVVQLQVPLVDET